jgi:2-polyprenyl-3-methyl-5-hydroxy-6-metoxy-1,4-benzoquinol methylase
MFIQNLDIRKLQERTEWIGAFDILLSCENIEHILDDFLLMKSMASCLKPGGRLLLTTPRHRGM